MRLRAAAVLGLLALGGCARCGQLASAKSAEELLPAQPAGAGASIALGQLARHAEDLLARGAELPGGEQVAPARKALAQQLGFDPLTREGLLAAGLDPDRGAAFALLPQQAGTWGFAAALPLTDPAAFAQLIEKLARDRAGYAERTEEARSSIKAVVFTRPGAAQKLGYALVRGYGLVVRGADPASELAAAAARAPAQSLAQDARFSSARTGLGLPDLMLYTPAQGALQTRLFGRPLPADLSAGLSGSARGVTLKALLQLAAPDAHEIMSLLPGGGAQLAQLLPKDAALLLRAGLAPAQLPAQLARLPRAGELLARLRTELAAKKVDLDADLFGSLEPGAVVSLGLAPAADLTRAVDGSVFDWRGHTPFSLLQLVAYARPRDPARLAAALQSVAEVLPQFGAAAVRSGAANEWQVSYSGGEGARFGLRTVDGAPLAYLLGGLSLDAALAQRGASGVSGTQAAEAQLDLTRVAAQVSALPPSSYGSGPQSYVARSLVSQVVEPLRPLVAHATLAADERGLTGELSIEIARAPDKAP